jgi:HNH endonuclease
MNCYYCNDPLNSQNKSEEHIIHQFLGGWMGSYKLLCIDCNTKKLKTIDDAISDQLGALADFIGVKRDRKKNPIIPFYTKDKRKFFFGPKGQPKYKMSIKTPDGKMRDFPVDAKDEKEFDELLLQKQRELGSKFKVTKIKPEKEKFFLKYSTDLEPGVFKTGGINFYRAIAKIAINYAIHKGIPISVVSETIDFLKVKKDKNNVARYYYPSHYEIYTQEKNEICHIIYLNADVQYKILYCYLELFSAYKFIIVLNQHYEGNPVEFFDGKDLINNLSINKKINIRLTRNHFLDLLDVTETKSMIDGRFKAHNELLKKIEYLFTSVAE